MGRPTADERLVSAALPATEPDQLLVGQQSCAKFDEMSAVLAGDPWHDRCMTLRRGDDSHSNENPNRSIDHDSVSDRRWRRGSKPRRRD
jgi:hypothetical protein